MAIDRLNSYLILNFVIIFCCKIIYWIELDMLLTSMLENFLYFNTDQLIISGILSHPDISISGLNEIFIFFIDLFYFTVINVMI